MLKPKFIVMGKVKQVYYSCNHPAFRGWEYTSFLPPPYYSSIEGYQKVDRIDEAMIVSELYFRPNLGTGRWTEIKRSDNLDPNLVPERDSIQINGKDYLIEAKSQRLRDGVIIYYIDYLVSQFEDEDSKARAQRQFDQITVINKKKEDRLRNDLVHIGLVKPTVEPVETWWQKLLRWVWP